MRAEVTVGGRRAHTARPWTGVNAVHRLAPVLAGSTATSRAASSSTAVSTPSNSRRWGSRAGVAGNVVPDRAVDHPQLPLRPRPRRRRVPNRASEPSSRDALDPSPGDAIDVVDAVPGGATGARPSRPGVARGRHRAPPRAKLGWTDVATFAGLGVPATNFGPGDPLLAHTPDEHVSRRELEQVRDVLATLLLTD